LKYLLEVKALVSTAVNIGSDIEFILRGRSFHILRTTEALELILVWELHVSMYHKQKEKI